MHTLNYFYSYFYHLGLHQISLHGYVVVKLPFKFHSTNISNFTTSNIINHNYHQHRFERSGRILEPKNMYDLLNYSFFLFLFSKTKNKTPWKSETSQNNHIYIKLFDIFFRSSTKGTTSCSGSEVGQKCKEFSTPGKFLVELN